MNSDLNYGEVAFCFIHLENSKYMHMFFLAAPKGLLSIVLALAAYQLACCRLQNVSRKRRSDGSRAQIELSMSNFVFCNELRERSEPMLSLL